MERTPTPTPTLATDGSGGYTLPTQRVTFTASQFTYGAYGEVLNAETLRASPTLHLGHKGLFVDRLDGSVADEITGEEVPRLEPGATSIYYARNRTYSPDLGRWFQKDPNATGLELLGKHAYHGMSIAGSVDDIGINLLYEDGLSLYAYLGAPTWSQQDPMGLWMWGDWQDTLQTGTSVYALAATLGGVHKFTVEEAMDWATDWEREDSEIDDLREIASAFEKDVDEEVASIAGPYAPLIAGFKPDPKQVLKLGKLSVKGLGFSARLMKKWENWFTRGPSNVNVYIGKFPGSTANWKVGISKDTIRRGKELGLKATDFIEDVTRNQARAIETELMKRNPHLLGNKIYSIADDHPFAEAASEFARNILKGKKTKF